MSGGDGGLAGGGGNDGERRLRGFLVHLAGYAAAMVALVAVNLALAPDRPWFVWPMVGWGGVLAIHVAYVMGGFGGTGKKR